MMEYRKELKFLVKEKDFLLLKNRIKSFMDLDHHSNSYGFYNIRSIYFDDCYNSFYYDNEKGLNERYKIRIRIYDKSDKIIKLEIKYKKNGLTKKESTTISKDLCLKIMRGEKITLEEATNNVLVILYKEQHLYLLVPKIIVEYEREAYIHKLGNVRVTFDRNIRVSKHINNFFDEDCYSKPILETGNHVLEIKYDELIPDYIAQILEINSLHQTAFSKYYLSRLELKEEVV